MEKDDIDEKALDLIKLQEKFCSKCKRVILPGEYYIEDILSNVITCSDCDDNRILIKGDNFFSID